MREISDVIEEAEDLLLKAQKRCDEYYHDIYDVILELQRLQAEIKEIKNRESHGFHSSDGLQRPHLEGLPGGMEEVDG